VNSVQGEERKLPQKPHMTFFEGRFSTRKIYKQFRASALRD